MILDMGTESAFAQSNGELSGLGLSDLMYAARGYEKTKKSSLTPLRSHHPHPSDNGSTVMLVGYPQYYDG